MILAAIETSTQAQSVALLRDGEIVVHASLPTVSTHGRELAEAMEAAARQAGLPLASITHFVVGAGPGSFTGLRVGLAYARGCALATGATVLLASSLRAMAYSAEESESLVAVALDARRGEVWSAAYVTGPLPRTLIQPAARRPDAFATALAGLQAGTLVGNGVSVYPEPFATPELGRWSRRPDAVPEADALARVAWNEISAGIAAWGGELDYLRDADAALPAVAQSRTLPGM